MQFLTAGMAAMFLQCIYVSPELLALSRSNLTVILIDLSEPPMMLVDLFFPGRDRIRDLDAPALLLRCRCAPGL
jgi:hypothetical protein